MKIDYDKARKEMEFKFENINWKGHPCGMGSKFENTKTIRKILPRIVKKFDIRTIADVGAGDLSWIYATAWPHVVDYKPYDIRKWHDDIIIFDVVSEVLPPTDLILCRYVLNHLPPGLINEAVERFRESGSKYILTTFHKPKEKKLIFETFWGEPVQPYIREGYETKRNRDMHYGLWRLQK